MRCLLKYDPFRAIADRSTWAYDFRAGKLYPKDKPGLGVEFDPSKADLVAEITEQDRPITLYRRPDGSITNW